jgi:peptide/nickel transport system substrate-binding protein
MTIRILVLALVVVLVWSGPGRAENVLRWASAISGLTFDPHAFNHAPTVAQNIQVYESLVDFDSDHSITPGLAVAWRPIDVTTWGFELRQGVHFHDGTPFTAEDVVFSLRRALSPQSEFAQALESIASVKADGDHVVRVRTTGPNLGCVKTRDQRRLNAVRRDDGAESARATGFAGFRAQRVVGHRGGANGRVRPT